MQSTSFSWLCAEEVISLTARPTSENKGNKLLIQFGRFLLAQLGYTCQDELQRIKRYRIVWGLLISYTMVSFRALLYDDPQSTVINILCTLQVFASLWGRHKDYITEKEKAAEEMAKKNNAIPIGKITGQSPWGIRVVVYLALFLTTVISIVYRGLNGDWSVFGDFSIVAMVIAFVDSGIEPLIGLFGATVDE